MPRPFAPIALASSVLGVLIALSACGSNPAVETRATAQSKRIDAAPLAAAEDERVVFKHYQNREHVGTTEILFRPGRAQVDERTAITRDMTFRPLGTWTSARYVIGSDRKLQRFAIGSTSDGTYVERVGRVKHPQNERPTLEYARTTFRAGQRPSQIPRRLALSEKEPLLFFDLNTLAPLVAFCRAKAWSEGFDAMAQAAPVRVLQISPDRRLESLNAFWLKRTRNRLPIQDRAVPCIVFSLRSTTERTILISVSEHEGELLKIEEPALGYSIERSFDETPTPKPIGLSAAAAFKRMTRLLDDAEIGLSLADRGQLEHIVYSVDMPLRREKPLTRPWQIFEGDARAGKLTGTYTVNANAEDFRDDPPAKEANAPAVESSIAAYAQKVRTQNVDDLDYVLAIKTFLSNDIAYAFNVDDPAVVLRTGFGNVTGKAKLGRDLLRASGIPSRPVTGLVYTGEAFVPHRWLEAWDKKRERWIPFDPTLGDISPLHLALGTPWVMRETDQVLAKVKSFRFTQVAEGKRGVVRWPDNETRVYGFYDAKSETLFGYVRSLATYGDHEGTPTIELETDLTLDYGRIKADGMADLRAKSIFDRVGRPVSFTVKSWLDGKEHRFATRIVASEATVIETGTDLKRIQLPADTYLAAETFYNHWAIYFAGYTPRAGERRTVSVLRPNKRRVYRWNLVHRGVDTVKVPGLSREIAAHRYDAVERRLRFWVSDAGLMIQAEDLEYGIRVRLDRKDIVQRF